MELCSSYAPLRMEKYKLLHIHGHQRMNLTAFGDPSPLLHFSILWMDLNVKCSPSESTEDGTDLIHQVPAQMYIPRWISETCHNSLN